MKDLRSFADPATYDLILANPPYSSLKEARLKSYEEDLAGSKKHLGILNGSLRPRKMHEMLPRTCLTPVFKRQYHALSVF